MHPARIVLVAVTLVLAVVGATAYLKYSSDMAAWTRVRESLTRLSSGVEFEPIISLRSRIADTDAAIKTFESGFHLFPRDYRDTLEPAKLGIGYMAVSLDDAKSFNSWEDMRGYLDVAAVVSRNCEAGHVAFSRDAIKDGFTLRAVYLIKGAAGELFDHVKSPWQERSTQPVDLTKENAVCEQQQASTEQATAERARAAAQTAAEREKAAVAAHLAAWKYHIGISLALSCSQEFKASLDGRGARWFTGPLVEESDHLDANQGVELSWITCGSSNPAELVSIIVNGAKYAVTWQLMAPSKAYYSARIGFEIR